LSDAPRSSDDVNLPRFLKVDTKAGMVGTLGATPRTAPIQRMEVLNGRLILQGGQEGRAWSATITGDTGRLSVGVVHDDVGFVVFGACTPHTP
jgi:hypothetical protein